jgi:glutamate/tyrosine decarboxylase-like PLP-dependent enzyme
VTEVRGARQTGEATGAGQPAGAAARDGAGPDLDGLVADLAWRIRCALEPPDRATASADAATIRALLDEPLPEHGVALDGLLEDLERRTGPGLAGTTGPRYFGFVTGGLLPGAALAQAWAAAVDQNVALWSLSPAGTELEQVTIRWLADLLEFPAGSGVFTSGATVANTVSLAVARHRFGERHGVDVRQDGVGALPPYAVYGSEELHLSDHKALRTLGLGSGCVRRVPIDDRYAMRADLLADAMDRDMGRGVHPLAVIAQAGSVNTGASDPLDAIADACAERDAWLHVDGAFGAFFGLCERTRPLVRGMGRADSLAVDGHKWLNLPHGTGWALLRDAELHRGAFAGTAGYLTKAPGSGDDLHELGIEASRSWRGVSAWAALKELGRRGVAELVTRCCDLTAELVALVEEAEVLEMTAPAPTCVACFRFRPPGCAEGPELDELNRRIQAEVAASGRAYLTGATLGNGFSLRAAIVSWRTRSPDVRMLVDAVEQVGRRLARD